MFTDFGGLSPLFELFLVFLGPLPDLSPLQESAKMLFFGENHFTGTVPEDLATLTKLETLYLSRNNLTGTLSCTSTLFR